MYANGFPPLTFDDLSRAVQRESWGLGQADEVSFPIVVSPDTAAYMNQQGDSFPVGTVNVQQPSGTISLFGQQIPVTTLALGILAVLAVGLVAGGRK